MSSSIILVLVLMVATLLVLGVGLGAMVMGGDFNKRYGNRLMTARVIFQALTICLVGVLFLVK